MAFLDDLPERHRTHDIAHAAVIAFDAAIAKYDIFVIQSKDHDDYGTDVQIEARDGIVMTNLRVHVQIKGTEKTVNADGSISVDVSRTNLNYLLDQPDAIYICFHVPSQRLLARYAHDIYCEYEHIGKSWREQNSVTVRFIDFFDESYQRRLHGRIIAAGKSARNRRLEWMVTPPEHIPALVQKSVPLVELTADPMRAKAILVELYNAGRDAVISASFSRFASVLDSIPGAMDFAYMAEINLGINGYAFDESRVKRAIEVLQVTLERGDMHPGSILYCQGNAWLALHAYEKARDIYLAALEKLSDPRLSGVTAHCCKNIGSALAALHDDSAAYAYYERALQLDPDLGEAHFAIALQLFRAGKDFHGALAHMEAITPRNDSSLPMSSVQGWRVELLFQNNDETGAFREIKNLLSMSDQPPWVWPFCARQVARFGRVSINATRKALTFWRSYLLAHPDDLRAERERLLCLWSLHAAGEPTETDFKKFKIAMVRLIEQGGSGAAFLWDRLGHWAQDEHDWIQAEEAYRKAYDLEPEHYGYCLGTALNFLDKHAEALPILLPQAEKHQPDAMSWFQVAVAREGVGDISGTIKAYELALELDPDYALAWFNLGGIYWNRGDVIRAAEIWKEAVTRFPNHSKTTMLLQQLPALFKGDAGIGGKSIF